MSFRFRKRVKVMKGVHLNLSKSGISTSLGGPGATVNLGREGSKATLGLPGTGLSQEVRLTGGAVKRAKQEAPSPKAKPKVPPISGLTSLVLTAAIIALATWAMWAAFG